MFGNAYVKLSAGTAFMSVLANLHSDGIDEAANYKPGQKIQLVCTGQGMRIGIPILANCRSKLVIGAKAANLIGAQIDDWIATGHLPPYAYDPKDAQTFFAMYWVGSKLARGSSCLSSSVNTETCIRTLKSYGNIAKNSEFRKAYRTAMDALKLPPLD